MTTTYSRDLAENLTGVTLPDGSVITNTFDTAHRLVAVSDLFGNQISHQLDALGDRLNSVWSGPLQIGGQRIHFANYDTLGRVIQDSPDTIDPITHQVNFTTLTLDSNGNALTVTDPLAHVAQRAFDGLNHLTRIIDAMGGITKLTYDAHDRPVTVVDANSGSTSYVYNGFGNVIQRISPDTGTTKYYYDPDGNLTQMIDGRGVITNYTYDALDRLLTVKFPAGPSENVTCKYDETGHGFGISSLTSVMDAAGTLSRTYDERGNVLTERRVAGTATLVTGYTYDLASRVASITYPSSWTVAYSRDAMGRVQSMNATPPGGGTPKPILSGVTWEPFGPPSAFTYGNGIAETRSFDIGGYRVIGLKDTGTATIQNLTYSYDAATNVLSVADAGTPGNSQTFGYDSLDHLTSAIGGYGTLGYTYSPIGNRLTQTVGSTVTNYAYAAHTNQLTATKTGAVTQTIAYTGAGNISSITPSTGGATMLTYNQGNRLASVTGTPLAISSMVYDAFGRRVSKVSGGIANYFTYGRGGELLEEANNGFPTDYVYLDGRPVAEIAPSTGKVYFLHNDRLGTPNLATDSGQNIVWSTTYQPFGQAALPTGSITQSLRFPGQYADAETGLNQNGFRDYAPLFGRYVESDPSGLGGGLNSFIYSSGNPVRYTDLFGLSSDCDDATNARESDSLKELKRLLAASGAGQDVADTVLRLAKQGTLSSDLLNGLNALAAAHTLVDDPTVTNALDLAASVSSLFPPFTPLGSFGIGVSLGKTATNGYFVLANYVFGAPIVDEVLAATGRGLRF